jgi:hypothetical protein
LQVYNREDKELDNLTQKLEDLLAQYDADDNGEEEMPDIPFVVGSDEEI